ncbi:MAG: hypothetical protein ACRES3_03470 [Steroidobacteraceae bacterium]
MPRQTGPGITRRSILLGALLPLTGCAPHPDKLDGGERDLASWLRGLIPDPLAAAAIGALYLRDRPSERSPRWLARQLFDSGLSRKLDRSGFQGLMQRVVASRERDFVDDDLVILGGWVVPRTEARLLTLIAFCSRS